MSLARLRHRWGAYAAGMQLGPSILVGIALLLLAAFLDVATGPDVASAGFYLPVLFWMTWKGGRRLGLTTAFVCGVVWLIISLLTKVRHGSPFIPYWNASIRIMTFALVSGLQSEIIRRKRAEQRLQQTTEERQKQANILESILNSMIGGVLVADSAGNFLHVNPAARRMLQIPAGSNLDFLRRLVETAPKQSDAANPLMRAARGENVDDAEVLLPPAKDEEEVWLSVTGRPLRTPDGTIAGGVVVFNDISARKRFERQIAEASNREQRRLGEDLHDGLCQQLVSTAFAARGLSAKLADQKLPEATDAAEIAELISSSIGQARDVARGLALVPLETGGLASALEELVMRTRSRHRIACRFVENGVLPDLEETVATNLFRIAQEAVTNAVKHGKATEIDVVLSTGPKQIQLEILDDGCGLAAPSGGKGMGMHIMNYRARTVGAALAVEPRSEGGTRLSCSVPRPKVAEQLVSVYGHEE